MQVIKTEFEGVLVFKPTVFRDTRGAFYENWHEAKYQEAGLHVPFIQDDFSISKNMFSEVYMVNLAKGG
jgi:dTDP-4-dehydrorhamnose 3,5-epimerase